MNGHKSRTGVSSGRHEEEQEEEEEDEEGEEGKSAMLSKRMETACTSRLSPSSCAVAVATAAAAAAAAVAAASATPSANSTITSSSSSAPIATGGSSCANPGPGRYSLNPGEMAAVKQLISGYRESAAFLLRSADELEQLLLRQT